MFQDNLYRKCAGKIRRNVFIRKDSRLNAIQLKVSDLYFLVDIGSGCHYKCVILFASFEAHVLCTYLKYLTIYYKKTERKRKNASFTKMRFLII